MVRLSLVSGSLLLSGGAGALALDFSAIKKAASGVTSGETFLAFLNAIKTIEDPPSTLEDAYHRISSATQFSRRDPVVYAGALKQSGILGPDLDALIDNINNCQPECRENNVNSRNPVTQIYPQAFAQDAPYLRKEQELRAAIYIPPGFTYGKTKPVVLVPGTGTNAGQAYKANLGKLLSNSAFGDPVYLNIPNELLNDAQDSAEFTAYAINYISEIFNNAKVGVIAWSQGSIVAQWALQYWPSVRRNADNMIIASGDFDGTIQASVLCTVPSCTPSVWQQVYYSNFIKALHSGGGESSWIPSTSIYSITDQIVQPQSGTLASAFIEDQRGVGASNNEVQSVCFGQPGGLVYPHEGTLYHPLTAALMQDALVHNTTGNVARLDLKTICSQPFAKGLTVSDIIQSEAISIIAMYNIFLGNPRIAREPPVRSYADTTNRNS